MAGTPHLASARPRIVPGLRNSSPLHWQSWLQSLYPGSVRVNQADWTKPDLEAWAANITDTLAAAGRGPWLGVAHSFGCLALARHLALGADSPLAAALLVAPADPDAFGLAGLLPQTELAIPTTLIASDTDPWMRVATARLWAQRWGSHWVNLGDAGHINAEAGFGPLPYAQRWLDAMREPPERAHHFHTASLAKWPFAVRSGA